MIRKEEFETILLKNNLKELILNMNQEEIENLFGVEVSKMVNYDQKNPHHIYDLLEHTVVTVENIPENEFTSNNTRILKISAFFHDIGKPDQMKERGVFWGHPEKSVEIASEILSDIGYLQSDMKKILFFIKHHDDFMSVKDSETKDVEKISGILERVISKNEDVSITDFKMLLTLCKADAIAQAEVIEKDGQVIDTRKDRVRRYEEIESVLNDALIYKQNKEQAKLEVKKRTLIEGPTPVVIDGQVKNQKQIDAWNELSEETRQAQIQEIDYVLSSLESQNMRLLEIEETSTEETNVGDIFECLANQTNDAIEIPTSKSEVEIKGIDNKSI